MVAIFPTALKYTLAGNNAIAMPLVDGKKKK